MQVIADTAGARGYCISAGFAAFFVLSMLSVLYVLCCRQLKQERPQDPCPDPWWIPEYCKGESPRAGHNRCNLSSRTMEEGLPCAS